MALNDIKGHAVQDELERYDFGLVLQWGEGEENDDPWGELLLLDAKGDDNVEICASSDGTSGNLDKLQLHNSISTTHD